VFNLIPLPPLDGSKVIKPILPYNAKVWFENHEQIFYIVFVALWIIGLLGMVISPIISAVYGGIMHLGLAIFGL
ncbi:MAG: site-2 protease family protein, partial [Clostridia bacterium]|nr:site-2 protease family protein [Clostridia bacterium]